MTIFERNLVRFLTSDPAICNIHFTFRNPGGDLSITPRHIKGVALAIQAGRIRVCAGATVQAGAAAQYSQRVNQIQTPHYGFPTNVEERGLLVHEIVHALIDLNCCRNTTRLSDESAAYMAQVMYLAQNGVKNFTRRLPQYQTAFTVLQATGIVTPTGIRPGQTLAWADYEPLRLAIQRRPIYQSVGWLQTTGANGVPSTSQHDCSL